MGRHKKNRNLNEQPAYTGFFKTPTTIHQINYSPQGFEEKEITALPDINNLREDSVSWIRVHGMTDEEMIIKLVKSIGLSELDARDILTTQHIMSVEEYTHALFVVMPVSYTKEDRTLTEQVCFIMGYNFLITIQESDYTFFNTIYNALKTGNYQKYLSKKADFLLASMLNEMINYYGDSVVRIEDHLESLEDELLDFRSQTRKDLITDIQEQRRKVIALRKVLSPFKDQFIKLFRTENELIRTHELPYFKDIYDQLLYILQNIESCREILSSLVDLYLNNNDVKMNQIMKQLTIVATIFIPLTFLVGIWGMNFKFMPELNWHYGYLFAWISMIGLGIGIWVWIKKKYWS
ncbi:magnesium/cobalt transporter CorA [Bacteroidales bacterium OttesenSCG-928-M11]|nr:magnesium/cobalt transporter CorA [Bacteroidales bacterium OttesenSCG-928-M11]